jgi:hypothetical protein
MNRIAGIVISVVGLLLAVLGIVKILPGAIPVGVFAVFVGLVVVGLSFIRRPEPPPHADVPLPLAWTERVTAVFYEPSRVFQNLRYHPRWLAGFLVIAIVASVYNIAFVQRVTPDVIALAPIEKLIEGGWLPPEAAEKARDQAHENAKSPMFRVGGAVNVICGTFVFLLILAGIFMLCALIFGGKLNFWQALSVSVYAALPVVVLNNVISLILLYVKSPDDIDPVKGARGLVRADLSILFKPAERPYLFVLCGSIGLLSLYGLWLEATGLHYTGEKISSGSAWTIALILWGIALLFGLGAAALFPTFVT